MRRATDRKGRSAQSAVRRRSAVRPVVFTAVDGTLLDFHTFDGNASRPIAEELAALGVPLVPVTEMTLEEIEPIARDMGMHHAMIIEAGGAIARWKCGSWEVDPCGIDADALLDVVAAVEAAAHADLIVYSVLPEPEAARLSGRSGAMLRSSTRRCFSEPFVLERGDIAEVTKAAEALGFSVQRGSRFFYLTRAGSESDAFVRVREELHCNLAIALGGSLLDAEFLSRSDFPIIVPGSDGSADPELIARLPTARIAPAPGSAGWAASMKELLRTVAGTRHPRERQLCVE